MWVLIESRRKGCQYWYNIDTGVSQWESPGWGGLAEREQSAVPPRRSKAHNGVFALHNWVKAIVIEQAVGEQAGASVLDVGCGRGGDAKKFENASVGRYVGLDLEERALAVANSRSKPCNDSTYVVADMSSPEGLRAVRAHVSEHVDAAFSMFAIHHAFGTVEGFECAMDLLCNSVRPGGAVGVIIPEGEAITHRAGVRGSFSNSLFSIELRGSESVIFDIQDATPSSAPEPLLTAVRLKEELAKRGFDYVVVEGTPRQFLRRFRSRKGQRQAMHVPQRFTGDQWALADLQYAVVARRRPRTEHYAD